MIVVLSKSCRINPHGKDPHSVGIAYCDANSFANLLCLHFGAASSASDEVAFEFSALLSREARPSDFFYQSYTVDPVGVSRRLLALMEDISLGGSPMFNWPSLERLPRIGDLARVAAQFQASAADKSLSEKLRRVLIVIAKKQIPNTIAELKLIEQQSSWRRLWRDLFAALGDTGTKVSKFQNSVVPSSDTDLSYANKRLSGDRESPKQTGQVDDSVFRIRGAAVFEAADATAALLRSELLAGQRVAVIRSGEAQALDDALKRQDLAAFGHPRKDRGAGPAEVLPLALSLAIGPVDPSLFLAFLNIEPNPLPSGLRNWLVRELENRTAVEPSFACSIVDKYAAKIEDKDVSDRVKHWKRWLHLPTLGSTDSIAKADVEGVLEMIHSWASRAQAIPETTEDNLKSYFVLLNNVAALLMVVRAALGSTFSKIQMQSLLAQSIEPVRCSAEREQSSVLVADDPGSLLHPVDTVIWWMAHDSALPRSRWEFWTDDESAALKELGTELQDPGQPLRESYESAITLLSLARKRFVMVTADRVGDEPGEVHPLWHEIEDAFQGDARPATRRISAFWKWLANSGRDDIHLSSATPALSFENTWELPKTLYAARDKESPSSLEKMLGCPLAWTLQYRAGLYDGSSHDLPDGYLLLGILAHACFEEFFKSGDWTLGPENISTRAAEIFDQTLATRAGVLLTRGRERERLEARAKTIAGMLDLARLMKDGGWEFQLAEEYVEATDMPQPVRGKPDLVFQRQKTPSEKLVVDVKYVGKRRRYNELIRGNAVQLATYSRILRSDEGSWPKTAYYIVVTRELLTVHSDIVPNLYRVRGEEERDVWSRIETGINETRGRLAQGFVDVGIDDDNPRSLAEAGRLLRAPCDYCDYRLFCRIDRRMS